MDVGERPILIAKEVERDGGNSTDKETPQKTVVDGTRTEHSPGAKSTPKDGSGKEGVVPGASEVVLLPRQADAGDLGHLVVEDGRADEGGDEGRPNLTVEGDPWSEVYIVGELEICGKAKSVRGRDETVRLEVVHRSGITGEPETTEEFGNNVQGNFDVRDGQDDATRDTEDYSEENCGFVSSGTSTGRRRYVPPYKTTAGLVWVGKAPMPVAPKTTETTRTAKYTYSGTSR